MTAEVCRRCLLFEYDAGLALIAREYVDGLPKGQRVSEEVYNSRLRLCRDCGDLINGMCRLCGCFVEVRAAKKLARCAKSAQVW